MSCVSRPTDLEGVAQRREVQPAELREGRPVDGVGRQEEGALAAAQVRLFDKRRRWRILFLYKVMHQKVSYLLVFSSLLNIGLLDIGHADPCK